MYDGLATLGTLAFLSFVFIGGTWFGRYTSKFATWEEFKHDFFN